MDLARRFHSCRLLLIFRDLRHLLVLYPSLSTVLSLVVLTARIAYPSSYQSGAPDRISTDDGNVGDVRKTWAQPWYKFLTTTALEPSLIAYGLTLVISSCSFTATHLPNYPAWVGVITWTYLLGLCTIRASQNPASIQLVNSIWTHTLLLYGLHWSITAVVFYKATMESETVQLMSPLGQGLLVTSLLLGKLLWEPIMPMATLAGPNNFHSVEKRASIVELATFSWLDPLIWTGFRKRLEVRDIWGLIYSDTSSVAVNKFQHGRLV